MRRETSSEDNLRPEGHQHGANWISIALFWYTIPIFRLGSKKDMTEEDLTKPLKEHKSSILGDRMARIWYKELLRAKKNNKTPTFSKVIFKCFATEIIIYGLLLMIMEILIRLHQPLFLGLLLRYFLPHDVTGLDTKIHPPMYMMRVYRYWTPGQSVIQKEEAYLYAGGVALISVLTVVILHPVMMGTQHVGMKLRVACCSLIYRKALRLSLVAMSGDTAGNVVNLMSNDVNRFDMALLFFHYLWIAPLQMMCALYFMYREMGISAVIGVTALLVALPVQAWFGNRTSVFRLKTALRTDERVRQMNEIIQSMQVIKMYAWEHAFSKLIQGKRKQEMRVLSFTSYIRGLIMSFIMFTTRVGIYMTVVSYVAMDKTISAEKVFVIISYYQILRQTMTVYFPQGIAQVAESNVAISRIKKFLMMDETLIGDSGPLNPSQEATAGQEPPSEELLAEGNAKVQLTNASAKYGEVICLQSVTLEIKRGELTTIIGKVGSGKSCLLNLILGELTPIMGKTNVKGVISYASQEPWLFAGSVRQNILFGRQYERRRYNAVVQVCALARDFTLLPYGDQTIVGERGISLSGGQRARVNLARAVYKKADIYLLDDPLSAVDTHVGKHLFDQCVTGYLSDKIVVLVTHQLQYLQQVEQVVIMDEGMIQTKGSYAQLTGGQSNFATFLKGQLPVDSKPDASSTNKVESILKHLSMSSGMNLNIIDKEGVAKMPKVQGEVRTYGSVQGYVYREYLGAGGNCCVIAIMWLMFIYAQLLASTGDYVLTKWVDAEETRHHENVTGRKIEGANILKDVSTETAIAIYSGFMLATIIVAVSRSVVFFTVCNRASVTLHNRMFGSIITASMKFFDTNTSGRILNRFSKDLGDIDEFLPNAWIDSVQILLNLLGALILVCVINYYLVAVTIVMLFLFALLRRYYLLTSRSVKRLDGITRSPCFGHLNATLQGLTTIRSNGAEAILAQEFDTYQDIHSSAWFMFIACSRAFGLWLDLICAAFIVLVTFSFLIFNKAGGEVGLAITQCISLGGMFQWGMKQSAELVNQMTSVERVLEYTKVEHEPSLDSTPEKKPPPSWPSNGRIEFKNLIMRYSPTEPPVLKNLNFVINSKEKIGIVGRTGAGKSSLISALFRLAYFDGAVLIDGLDTNTIGLHDLRRKVSIIPQEPVLFSGTLRYNLDPFNEYDDKSMVNALVVVEIKSALLEGVACLDNYMAEGGTNISVGERQMVCLARAILRNNIILVLDEATANVDPQTDKFIQTTIRKKFAQCTVLTIAHRLHTIMDSDRVLVMDAGIAVEFDHPYTLMQNPEGYLTKMVEKTGTSMAENLKKIAKENFQLKQKKPGVPAK